MIQPLSVQDWRDVNDVMTNQPHVSLFSRTKMSSGNERIVLESKKWSFTHINSCKSNSTHFQHSWFWLWEIFQWNAKLSLFLALTVPGLEIMPKRCVVWDLPVTSPFLYPLSDFMTPLYHDLIQGASYFCSERSCDVSYLWLYGGPMKHLGIRHLKMNFIAFVDVWRMYEVLRKLTQV